MSEGLPSPGDRLSDRYVIQRELGRGGAAVVYLAEDVQHGRVVAVKVLRPELAATIGDERFLREIETAARLSHPNILPLHDSGRTGRCLFYVMPCVSGDTLRDHLARERHLPVDEVLAIAREVGDAVEYAHGEGIVHRDIKPENVLFQAGHAVVADFGIATALEVASDERLTAAGMGIGTAPYMSPEQVTGERVDGRSDQYSLAAMLYEMLSGQPPHHGGPTHVMLARRLTEPVPPLRAQRGLVPEQVDAAIRRALSPLPADRFRTVREFVEALGAPPASMSAVSEAGMPRRRGRTALGAGVLVLGVLVVLVAPGVLRFRGSVEAASGARIAVVPFSVGGTGALAYLGEGVVDLLSRNLDGAGELRSVDSGTILSALGGQRGTMDVERARALAHEVGAAVFVVGSVQAIGDTVRIHAELYERDGAASFDQARVQGDTTDLFGLMDRLSGELLIKLRRDPSNRMAGTAAQTTKSLPALKLYLAAEAKLRGGQPDSAILYYQGAVAEDSTFALAYYRLAVAAGWAVTSGRADGHALANAAAARALQLEMRLSERERRLLQAYVAFRAGRADEAERGYRVLLHDYPGDIEAEFQLADLQFHYNPLRGRSVLEAREAFDQVLAYDPGFL